MWTSWLHFYHCFILFKSKTNNTNRKQRSEEWIFIYLFFLSVCHVQYLHDNSGQTRTDQNKKLVFRGPFYQQQKLLFEICFSFFWRVLCPQIKAAKTYPPPLQCYADHLKVFITESLFDQWTWLQTVVIGTISLLESSSNKQTTKQNKKKYYLSKSTL